MNLNLLLSCLFLLNSVEVVAEDDSKKTTPKIWHRCKVCSKYLSTLGNLTTHQVTHSDERPFACEVKDCNQKFKRRSNLKSHSITHSGVKPFCCDVCEKGYSRKAALQNHQACHIFSEEDGVDSLLLVREFMLKNLETVGCWQDKSIDITPSVGPVAKKRAVAGVAK
jgi:uncharacterized Zn-finger protein